jgi:uncharacterized protein YciI
MFIVLLRFSGDKAKAGRFMEGHKDWIRRGFDDGVFLMTGSLEPNRGGMVLAAGVPRADLEIRLSGDPFVVEGIVDAEILEVTPSRADSRLGFLA